MKHAVLHSRRARYGGLTVSLTAALIAALVLLNVIFFTLAKRFSWFIDMTPDKVYSVSEMCHELIEQTLRDAADEGEQPHVEVIFCEDYRTYAPGSSGAYIVNTVNELVARHPDAIELRWFDCFLDVSQARELGVTNSTNIVIRAQNGEKRVLYQQEFFTFEGGNTTSPVGYDGERVIATTLSSLLRADRPLACLTLNHDERFYDQTLVFLLRDAGYTVSLIDLYYESVPDECTLLVVYNPSTDFIVSDGISQHSELDKLSAHLDKGHDMMVFLSANTPELPHFESFLSEWGVKVARHADETTGHSYSYMVKDASAALTSDGFTIFGAPVTRGAAAELLSPLTGQDFVPGVVFRDATVLSVADGFVPEGGSYRRGDRLRHDVFVASDSARAFSSGKQLPDTPDEMALMTLTESTTTGARLLTCASTEYAAQSYLQSAVFGNADTLLCVLRDMGMEDVLIGLRYKPFASSTISSITTVQTTRWTVALTVLPALCVLTVATIILVRRKHS